MNEYPNTCVTCLSNNRKLVPLNEVRSVLQYIHFTELKSWNRGICWECKITIMKFYKFKSKALQVQHLLLNKVQNLKPLTKLGIKVNVPYNYHYKYEEPLICENESKIEIHIKEEIKNSDNEESEIENAGSDLNKDLKIEMELTKHDCDDNVKPTNNLENDDNKILISSVTDSNIKFMEINPLPCSSNSHLNTEEQFKEDTATKYLSKEDRAQEYSDKFIKVIRSEKEMLQDREDKRNHPYCKKMLMMPFKCDFCVLGFSTKKSYEEHVQNSHDESIGPYACHVCNVRFESMLDLGAHRKIHYIYYKCQFCKYTTSQQREVLKHCKLQHKKEGEGSLYCQQCKAVLSNQHELEEHMKIQHSIHCKLCGLNFINHYALKKHRSQAHERFICDICKQSFITKSRLETHMTRHSALIKKNMSYCSECKVQFNSLGIYRNHIRTSSQHAKSIFPCSECDKVFPSKTYLKRHYNYMHVHDAKHYCAACDKSFVLPYQLTNHNKVHHGMPRSRDHACNECGKKFFTSRHLRSHQQIHSEKRSYMCAQCGNTFKQKTSMYNHLRLVHKGEKKNK